MKYLMLILLVFIFACDSKKVSTPTVETQDTLTAILDSHGQTFIDNGKVIGFSVAIMQGVDTVYNKGFGFTSPAKTESITNQTRFKIASISKLMGATIVMKLVEEGKLSLDQTLFELLPDFPNPEQAKKITLRQMLSHTSGLQDYASEIDSMFLDTGVAPTMQDFNAFFKDRELFFEPGSNYSYCNSGYLLMGWIIEKATGNSLQNEIDRVINEPTGMKLKLISEAVNDPNMAPYWELKKDSTFIPYPHWTWIKGDGGITATTIMLAQFPRLWAHGKIISDASFREMITPIVLTDGIQTGYGIGVRNGEFYGEKIIGHTGGNKSTYAIMLYFPARDLTIVVCMNTDHTPVSVRNIFREFARVVMGKDVPDFSNQEVPLEGIQHYTGMYYTHDYKIDNAISIEVNNESNILNYCVNRECEPLVYVGNNKFWIKKWPYDLIEFHVDDDGKVLAIKEYYSGAYVALRKRKE